MRDYSKISSQIWTGRTGKQIRALGPEAQVVAFYLMTSPHSNMIGLYYLPLGYLSADTGLPLEGASKALLSLIEIGFCTYDRDSEVVWVYEMAKIQVGESLKANDNQCGGVASAYRLVQKNCYLAEFYDRYKADFHLKERREWQGEDKGLGRGLEGAWKQEEEEGTGEGLKNRLSQVKVSSNGEPSDRPLPETPKLVQNLDSLPKLSVARAIGDPPVDESEIAGKTAEERSRNREKLVAVKRVFAYYLEKTGRSPVLYSFTELRRQKGMSRMDEALRKARGSLPDAETLLAAAVDALLADDWNMGRDPRSNGKKYIEWDKNLFNDAGQLDRWLTKAAEQERKERRSA